MSLRDASDRSSALLDGVRSTFQQISKLVKEPEADLAQEIHDELKQHEEALDLLQQDVEVFSNLSARSGRRESERSRETARLTAQVSRLNDDLRHARSQFRRAQLGTKRAQEAADRTLREQRFETLKQVYTGDKAALSNSDARAELFAGRQSRTKQLTEDELLLNTSSDITAALRATHDRLTSELSRSRFAQETLEQSTAALSDLGERYSSLDTLLANSRTLLGTLVKSQKSDTWYLETAFYLLVATLGWLIFRRLIYGPAWWFIWLPLKFFIFQPFAFLLRAFGGSPDGVKGLQEANSARPALRVQPSAQGRAPGLPEGVRFAAHPVGGGGYGAKQGARQMAEEDETLSAKIGRMVEDSKQKVARDQAEEKKRGDGTVLEQRGQKPPNPKKKMFEMSDDPAQQPIDHEGAANAADQKQQKPRDEL